ncbi:hypothetical protein [Acanthopleuribacter pedis]|uniref:Uncharacterized protein n=1 Tax=Acanthopleuribacter pedis TaxID=442870 RepID=A0A8J7QLY6_9BACT|nr:hypothetical protein [Acanthopleuribacter pedis]MBO1320410.1 hypothetical protein [Acanthopleuribacter pedis]
MKGMEINVGRRFVEGSFAKGSNVDQQNLRKTFTSLSSWVVTPPKTLALFNHNNQTHVSTGVTQQQFQSLSTLDQQQTPTISGTQLQQVKDILDSVGINHSSLSNRQKLRAAVMLGNNEVSGAWLKEHTKAIRTGDDTAITAGKILHEAYLFANAQQKGGLQGPSDSLHTKLAMKIADAVIKPNGDVDNLAIAEMMQQLKDDVLAGKLKAGPHHKAMAAMLGKFGASHSMREKLGGITAPRQNSPQERMLQATLGKTTSPLSNRDARVAVLSAMLADLRQGQVGSCFGTSIAIHLKKDHPEKMLDHLKDMVENGRIRGSYKRDNMSPTQNLDMPMNTSLKDTQIAQKMKVSSDGTITHLNNRGLGTTKSITDIPGLHSALSAVGITENQDTVLKTAITRMRGQNSSVTVSPKELLDNIIDNTHSIGQSQKTAMKTRASDHFHSQVENRLLRSYEYTLSGLAEGHFVSPTLRSFANNLIAQMRIGGSIQTQYDKIENQTDQDSFMQFTAGFPKRLTDLVDKHIILQYDATLPHSTPSPDGRSLFGGFAVHFRDPITQKVTPLTNKSQLRKALTSLVGQAKRNDLNEIAKKSGPAADKLRTAYQAFQKQLTENMKSTSQTSDTFMDALLPGIKNLQLVPLGFPRGANPLDVMRTIFGTSSNAQVDKLPKSNRNPNDGGPVLKQMVTTMRHIHSNIQEVGKGYSQKDITKMTVPVMNEPHAFLLDASLDPKFAEIIKSEGDIDVWMKKTLLPKELDTYQKTDLEKSAVRLAVSQLSSRLEIDVDTVMSQLDTKGSTKPKDVLDVVYQNVASKHRNQTVKDQIGQLLAEKLAAPVERVLVADTNWGDGESHIYFGMVYNPFSTNIEMWNFEDDGQSIKPRGLPDQKRHVQVAWTIAKDPHDFGY